MEGRGQIEKKQPMWDKAQSLIHKDDKGRIRMENAYGKLRYVKEDREGQAQGRAQTGFVLEAKEAPGTPLHTEKEKRLQLDKVSRVKMQGERFLYAQGKPFKAQAFFYDVSEWEKSRDFMKCMKRMLDGRGHRALKDTFGFLEQSPERLEKEILQKERGRALSLEEFAALNHKLDALNDHLQKKEAKERQLSAELQLMIDRGKEEERKGKKPWSREPQEAAARNYYDPEADTAKDSPEEGETGQEGDEEEKKGKMQ